MTWRYEPDDSVDCQCHKNAWRCDYGHWYCEECASIRAFKMIEVNSAKELQLSIELGECLACAMNEKIESLRTGQGGWSRSALAQLGIEWPPTKGWKKQLETQHPHTCGTRRG